MPVRSLRHKIFPPSRAEPCPDNVVVAVCHALIDPVYLGPRKLLHIRVKTVANIFPG